MFLTNYQKLHKQLWNKDQTAPDVRRRIFTTLKIPIPTFSLLEYAGELDHDGATEDDNDTGAIAFLTTGQLRSAYVAYSFPETTVTETEKTFLNLQALESDESVYLPCGPPGLLVTDDYQTLLAELYGRQKQFEEREVRRTRNRKVGDIDRTLMVDLSVGLNRRPRNLLISGNQGIGKSFFLSFVLVDRLLKGLPTVFLSANLQHTIFTSNGVSSFTNPEDDQVACDLLRDSSVWYLADAEPHLFLTLQDSNDWMIVQTSSMTRPRDAWEEQKSGLVRYMHLWSWEDIAAVGGLQLGPNHMYTLFRNFTLYGPIPRLLLRNLNPSFDGYVTAKAVYDEDLNFQIWELLPGGKAQLQLRQDTDSNAIVLTQPLTGNPYRYEYTIASHHVAWLICKYIYPPPTPRPKAALKIIFEGYVHQHIYMMPRRITRLGGVRSLDLEYDATADMDMDSPLLATGNGRSPEPSILQKLISCVTGSDTQSNPDLSREMQELGSRILEIPFNGEAVTYQDLGCLTPGSPDNSDFQKSDSSEFLHTSRDYYCHPAVKNHHNIDGFVISKHHVFCIQIATSREHPVSAAGLEKLYNAMHEDVQKMTWVLVFVIPKGLYGDEKDYPVQEIKRDLDDSSRVEFWEGVEQYATSIGLYGFYLHSYQQLNYDYNLVCGLIQRTN
ncbi:hypothetical protein TWF696_006151 [Orbilia brochopaga]|uniref:Uncharacterized protein n=1 Tax=Orbilia brochopaga TaxID=3140254 RepID=A0AAV9UVC0_9PEZI